MKTGALVVDQLGKEHTNIYRIEIYTSNSYMHVDPPVLLNKIIMHDLDATCLSMGSW